MKSVEKGKKIIIEDESFRKVNKLSTSQKSLDAWHQGFLLNIHPVNIARSLEKGEKVFDQYREKWAKRN